MPLRIWDRIWDWVSSRVFYKYGSSVDGMVPQWEFVSLKIGSHDVYLQILFKRGWYLNGRFVSWILLGVTVEDA